MNTALLYLLLIVIAFFLVIFVIILFPPRKKATVAFPAGTEEKIAGNEKVVLKIAVPRNNDKTPLAAEQLFASLHGLYKETAEVPILVLN